MHQRKFIFLEDIDEYSVKNNNLKGHAQFSQMKSKVAIKLFVEGLGTEEYGVDLLLEESTCTNIGNFYSQKNSEKVFYVNNSIKEINAILIYPITDKKNITLVGYLKDKINIKEIEYLRIKKPQENKNSQGIEKEIKNAEKELITYNKEYIPEEIKETSEKNTINDEEELNVNLSNSQIERNDEVNDNDNDKLKLTKNVENVKNIEIEESTIETKSKGAIYNNQIFYLWDNLDKLDNSLKPANPFMQPVPKHKWWQIKEYDTEIQYYCILYNGYLMPMIYPFMNYKNISMIEKDWVFGVVTEDYGEKEVLKYFVYGIPGKFYMQEQPFKGSTGYLYWQSSDVIRKDPMGYWLLYVDVHTGKIVIPRRPVKPPLNKNIMHNNM